MSLIIDGMDQSHCRVPYLGTQGTFSDPLKQCLTGVKEHGHGITLYRTFDTVRKGSNLTIHCILSQLDKWKERYKKYPEKIYLQVDGGSENANQYVLAVLELLVHKRMAKQILYTRLPTGHTHEDIDACFALIWSRCRNCSCETVEQYKANIIDAFKDTKLNPTVEDIVVVPDYATWITPSIDRHLANLHHDEETQHQWKFEAVKPSPYFQLGVKTIHRAYSSDRVVELVKKPKDQCLSRIGQLTGLEAVTLYCCWYPSPTCIPERPGIEGFTILRSIPETPPNRTLTPQPFPPGVIRSINKCTAEVRRRYDIHDDARIRQSWDTWKSTVAPTSDDADFHVNVTMPSRGQRYHIPLRKAILNRNFEVLDNEWDGRPAVITDPSFKWPEVIAAAMNCVESEQHPIGQTPRLYSITDASLLSDRNYFHEATDSYYMIELNSKTVTALSAIIGKKLTYKGETMSTSGV